VPCVSCFSCDSPKSYDFGCRKGNPFKMATKIVERLASVLPKGISETDEEKEKHWFIGSIDQGTTSSRFLIFNGEGSPVAQHQIEFENMYPKSG
jgi:hypothetical protein